MSKSAPNSPTIIVNKALSAAEKTAALRNVSLLAAPSLLAACGGGGGGGAGFVSTQNTSTTLPVSDPLPTPQAATGLPASYTPPASVYVPPATPDPNRFVLQTEFVDPYWVAALRSESFDQITASMIGAGRTIAYAFPETQPEFYDGLTQAAGWQPANAEIRAAYADIFASLEMVLDIRFVETADAAGENVIAISRVEPADPNTGGYAFFPSAATPLGSDILISVNFDTPVQNGDGSTNFDYEVLVHELGHALGLKHPFEADGTSTETLSEAEDSSILTTMSYNFLPVAYDGEFRAFDLMALTEAYGVNPTFRAGDDVYSFSSQQGVFVIDGAGTDTITAAGLTQSVTIDLRDGEQSHVGVEGQLISGAFQLTISPNTAIENAVGGAGNDLLTGNELANRLEGGAGDDLIFAGEGADTVIGGAGDDVIDLSEVTAATDTVVVDVDQAVLAGDQIYSFQQGAGGDAIDVVGKTFVDLLDVVSVNAVPAANVHGNILRLTDALLDSSAQVRDAFADGGAFENLDLALGGEALIVAADSQNTGEDQRLFHVQQTETALDVTLLATFTGNYLDIDNWQAGNFA